MTQAKPHRKSRLMLFTGKGKGKTTAALGSILRASGHGMPVAMIQFIKGGWSTGERKFLPSLKNLDYFVMGEGFTWESDDIDRDRKAAWQAWQKACELMQSGQYQLVVLDELSYVAHYGWLPAEEILTGLESRHPRTHVIATGRHMPSLWQESADLVSDIVAVKHPFANGEKAMVGLEF